MYITHIYTCTHLDISTNEISQMIYRTYVAYGYLHPLPNNQNHPKTHHGTAV